MKPLSDDTHPDAEQFQLDLIRKASVPRRLQMAASLTKTTRWLSWQAICKRHPNATSEERIRLFLLHHYGDKLLAGRVAEHLRREMDSDGSG